MSTRATSTPSTADVPWWGRIDSLWLVATPLCALMYTLCLPLAPNDLWYHARAGWYIATHQQIPTTNLFTWGVSPETPYHYQSWIAELLIFLTLSKGLAWAAVLRSFCFAVAIGLVLTAGYRQIRSSGGTSSVAAKAVSFGSLLAFLIASNNVDLRPQTFSLVFFALWVFLLYEWGRSAPRKQLILGWTFVSTACLWANTHGAFPTGLMLLGIGGIGQFFTHRSGKLFGFWVLSLLAVCINPRGPAIFSYLSLLATNETSQRFIQEWQPPHFGEWHSALFLISPVFLAVAAGMAWRRKRSNFVAGLNIPLLVGGLALYCLALRSARSMVWYALWFAPMLAILVASSVSQPSGPEEERVIPRPVQFANAFILAVLLLLPISLLPWFKTLISWPPEFRDRFAPTPRTLPNGFPVDPELLLESDTPVRAAEFLQRFPAKGRIWNEMVYGSYLLWALHPQQKPLCDPRVELYPTQFWTEYLRLSGGPQDSTSTLNRLGVSDALLDKSLQPKLVDALSRASEWELVFRSGNARLFRRKSFGENFSTGNSVAR